LTMAAIMKNANAPVVDRCSMRTSGAAKAHHNRFDWNNCNLDACYLMRAWNP
jgi:hypothetical protein